MTFLLFGLLLVPATLLLGGLIVWIVNDRRDRRTPRL